MLRFVILLAVLFALLATGAIAHGPGGSGHGPRQAEITEIEAGESATAMVASFVQKGKLDVSWTEVEPTDVQKKEFSGSPEWVITFKNPKEKDADKQTLYVFLSVYGQYLGANHTGS